MSDYTDTETETIKKLRDDGYSFREIAEAIGRPSASWVRYVYKKAMAKEKREAGLRSNENPCT
jgi:IS30 family transposase